MPDANGQALAYVYSRDNEAEARQAKMLTTDEARRIATNIARLPELLGKGGPGLILLREFGPRSAGRSFRTGPGANDGNALYAVAVRPSWALRDVADIDRAYMPALRSAAATDQSAASRSPGCACRDQDIQMQWLPKDNHAHRPA
jgi:hypothetical protein